ncbi:MAG: 2-amino-4-hydroxy-6-hydroxymethyldihydropteridine diphosphokinase [Planctomycetes bacterium]|nr:2-amino-4-hydroxy-6-hydroxymethyldihydropteridine diphosphokinase [Planctomycetota bacterium]MBI3844113.1 2-amino-4-hydroxy-6-hydroxymethyldihydropteridine diphosphokinase [Planctomycetota bacterium]
MVSPIEHRAFIALGGNLGERERHLDCALAAIAATPGVRLVSRSRFVETDPVPKDGPPQPRYLNGACEVRTTLTPRRLLDVLLAIERGLGRVRAERNGPRTIDLDLLLVDDLVIDEPGLVVPHPRMTERRFVLEPLAEIAADFRHPLAGCSIADLLAALAANPRT